MDCCAAWRHTLQIMESDKNIDKSIERLSADSLPPASVGSIARSTPRPPSVRLLWFALIAVTATLWWAMHSADVVTKEGFSQELAKRDASFDQKLAKATVDHHSVAVLRERVNALEAQLDQVGNQTAALETQYQDLRQSRDERLLADLEQSVMTASQQLQLAGNVEGAIIVLQSSELRLAANPSPRFVALRRLIVRDIDRLKSSAIADSSEATLKLEKIIGAVDAFPLAFEQRVNASPVSPAKSKAASPVAVTMQEPTVSERLRQLVSEIWQEVRQLVRIERVDLIEPALLMPPQIYFLRENLKLRLLAARVALLQRDGKVYQEELRQAQSSLIRFFDTRAASVQTANEILKTLMSKGENVQLPNLEATLNAIRATKIPRVSP